MIKGHRRIKEILMDLRDVDVALTQLEQGEAELADIKAKKSAAEQEAEAVRKQVAKAQEELKGAEALKANMLAAVEAAADERKKQLQELLSPAEAQLKQALNDWDIAKAEFAAWAESARHEKQKLQGQLSGLEGEIRAKQDALAILRR